MTDYATQVNGHIFGWSSIKLTPAFDGVPQEFERFVSIDYEHSLEVGELRGVGPNVLGHGSGEYRARASVTLYLSDWRELRLMLSRLPGEGGFMQKLFHINVQYSEAEETTVEDVLRGCRVIRASKAYRRGSEPLMVSVDLFVTEIIEDGLNAVRFNDFGGLVSGLALAGA